MPDALRLQEQTNITEASVEAIDLVLDADSRAISIRLNETQTMSPFAIKDNADVVVFHVHPEVTTGVFVDITADTITTGAGIQMNDLNALTTGIGVHVASSATAITGAGRLGYFNHTGATSTSGVLFEVASAATDETVVARVTASGALAAGVALDVTAAAMTTGTGVQVAGAALTTGSLLLVSDTSADTGTRSVVKIVQDDAAATGATGLEIQQDGDSYAILISGITTKGIDLTAIGAGEASINFTDGNASSIDPSATAESGWINIAVGGVIKYVPYYAAS